MFITNLVLKYHFILQVLVFLYDAILIDVSETPKLKRFNVNAAVFTIVYWLTFEYWPKIIKLPIQYKIQKCANTGYSCPIQLLPIQYAILDSATPHSNMASLRPITKSKWKALRNNTILFFTFCHTWSLLGGINFCNILKMIQFIVWI